MNKAIPWLIRKIPIQHLTDLYVSNNRKNIIPKLLWVDCLIEGARFRLKVNTGEVHGYLCYMYGMLEPSLSFFVRHLITSKSSFLDIGANVGYYTVLAASVNRNCCIYSFEPSPTTYQILSENVIENQLSNVRIYQLALNDKDGELKFNIYEDQALNSPSTEVIEHPFYKNGPKQVISVQSVRLDDFFSEHHLHWPEIVKLDVEGFEYFVLQGAKNLLSSLNPPILLCEVQPLWMKRFGLSPSNLFEYVEKFGYKTFILSPYGLISREALGNYPSEDIIFAPSSAVNEILDINNLYYSGFRKAKGEFKKLLRPIWRQLKK
jgi:FkbM family methyltransferase